ncbi:MAG: hypothetical protein WA003_01580, partial [Desulfuromonadaceae bacterium]
ELPNNLAVNIDGTLPLSSASVSGVAGTNGWYKSPATVLISGTDVTSGVGSIKYRKSINGSWGSTITGGNPSSLGFGNFSSGGNGRYSVGYYAVDRACNAESERFVGVDIDSTAPVSTYTPSILPGANGWYTGNVTATFTATDNLSGVSSLTVDGAIVPGAIASYLLSAEGIQTLNYFATDFAGVDEASRSVTVRIDKTVPVVTLSTSPATLVATNKAKLVPVTINGSATDSLSGIASVLITITDEYGSYSMTVPSFGAIVNLDTHKNNKDTDGRLYTVKATAIDLAGNQQTSVYNLFVK